jgi:hypothetical protein
MDDEMKKASEDFTVKIERIENNRTKHSFSLWENVSDASFASELTSAGMYVVKSANIVLLILVALLAFIVASMLRAQDISLRTHLYSMGCFLQVGIPHFCKTFSPAPVGKIKLT